MLFPTIAEISRTQEYTQTFAGLNRGPRIADGEWADMKNLSGDAYPVVCPRRERSLYYTHNGGYIRGIYMKGGHIVHVSSNTAYVDGVAIGLSVSGGTAQPVRIVGMGVHVVFFPGGEWFDLVEYTTSGKLTSGVISARTEVSCGVTNPETGEVPIAWYHPAREDGTVYENVVAKEPENPADGTLWVDTSGEAPVAKVYNAENDLWVIVAITYIRIEGPGIGVGLNVGDGVTITGAAFGYGEEFTTLVNGSFILKARDDNWILIPGILGVTLRQPVGTITVKREFPQMDYVVEANNRLWGCKYGQTYVDGKAKYVNEIYACALGDFRNWNKYEGLSTDSYSASRGSDGPWTGAIVYQGKPMFFKSDSVDIVTVGSAGNHSITTRQMRGLQAGSSLAIVNEVLYYCTGQDIVAYNGTYPSAVSGAIPGPWEKATAGALGNKYYVCLTRNGESAMYVYDTAKGFWHKEDETAAEVFAGDLNGLFFVSGPEIWKVETGDRNLEWMAETGDIGLSEPGKKYISRVVLRANVPKGAYIDVSVQYDSGEWRYKGRIRGNNRMGSQPFPILPIRCDHMRIRLGGYGDARLYSIGKVREGGSEL